MILISEYIKKDRDERRLHLDLSEPCCERGGNSTVHKDNVQDSIECGTHKNPWERLVEKYGLEQAKKMQARGNKSAGGKALKGTKKTEEHKKKISEAIKKKNAGVTERHTY